MRIGRRKEIRIFSFRAPAVRRIRSDEGLSLETSAFETHYGGQFTLSTELLKPNYLVTLPTDAPPNFFLETHPLYSFVFC